MNELNINTNSKTIALLFLLSGVTGTGCIRDGNQKPNFLIIITDDQTYRAIGYNNDVIKTPNIDKLATNGLIFNRAYVPSPICVASRASLMTGMYPQTNGTVALNLKSFITNVVSEKRFKTLPQILSEAGYTTLFCGKSHLGSPSDYGFQAGEESHDYTDKKTFKDASEFISRIAATKDRKPFFLWVAARQPHLPLLPEKKWIELYKGNEIPLDKNFREKPVPESFYNQGLPGENFYRDSDYTRNYKNLPAGPPRSSEIVREFSMAYYATISHLDYQIGELIEQMYSKELMKNTIVIFFSDNGYFLGNHGLGNKLTMHEESVRVPFFIYYEKLKNRSSRTDAIISSIDIFPTILDLAGINIPENIQGISLKSLLSGDSENIRDYVVSESVGSGGKTGEGHRMVVTSEWKYMLSDIGDEALFKLGTDIYELDNLIKNKEYNEKVSDLKSKLIEWKRLTGDKKTIPD